MAKERMINTRIWSDGWFSQLDPIEKLLFLYFLTNSYTNISGIYEMPIKVAAVETGIDPSMIDKILPRMKPKVYHQGGWVIIPNFPKYQTTTNPKIMAGIQRELALVPKEIYSLSIAYGYPIALNLTYTKPIGSDESQVSVVKDEPEAKPSKAKYPHKKQVFTLFRQNYPRNWDINTNQCKAAENLFVEHGLAQIKKALEFVEENKDEKYFPEVITPYDLDSKWSKIIKWRNSHGS